MREKMKESFKCTRENAWKKINLLFFHPSSRCNYDHSASGMLSCRLTRMKKLLQLRIKKVQVLHDELELCVVSVITSIRNFLCLPSLTLSPSNHPPSSSRVLVKRSSLFFAAGTFARKLEWIIAFFTNFQLHLILLCCARSYSYVKSFIFLLSFMWRSRKLHDFFIKRRPELGARNDDQSTSLEFSFYEKKENLKSLIVAKIWGMIFHELLNPLLCEKLYQLKSSRYSCCCAPEDDDC